MGSNNYVAFISNGKELSASGANEIVELEVHDQLIQSDECTCTNKAHINSCEIENVAIEIENNKKQRSKYIVEMAFCQECGAYYIPQKSYEFLESKGELTHRVKGGIRLFEYLDHGPAFEEEKDALNRLEKLLQKEYDKLPKVVSRYAIDDGCGGLRDVQSQKFSAQNVYKMQDELQEKMDNPYVGRIDVSNPDGTGRTTYYIGRTEDKLIGDIRVYSRWSEEGRLFGRTAEENGVISGSRKNVDLRRNIDIRSKKLKGIEDTFSSNTEFAEKGIYDKFLIQVLMSRKKSHQLTDIIATIQEKQNEIIEKAYVANIIVQGCAGSGKTMVLLHRLSFWLYNNKSLKPERIKILTPNENFNVHIGGLHSQLNLGDIEIMSVDQYYAMLLRKYSKDIAYSGSVAEEENIEERLLNYIYSKAFLKEMDKNYEEVIAKYALPEELDLLEDCAIKCNLPYNVNKTLSDGDIIEAISRLGHNIKAKNGTAFSEKTRVVEKLEKLRGNRDKSEELIQESKETINQFIENYKSDIRNILIQAERESIARKEEATQKEQRYTEEIAGLNSGLRRLLRAATIKQLEEDIAATQKEIDIEDKMINGLNAVKDILDNAEDINTVIDEISSRKNVREQTSISDYVSSYRKASRTLSERNSVMNNEQNEIQELEEKLTTIEVLLSESEISFINDLCEKYPVNISLVIFNECFDKSIEDKLVEFAIEKPSKVYRYELYARLVYAEKHWNKVVGEDELICVDEGQDVSYYEYERIIEQNRNNETFYNVFGDLNQRIKQGRGLSSWEHLKRKLLATEFMLNENYRNTNQITQYCNETFNFDMTLTGVDGDPVRNISFDEMIGELVEVSGLEDRSVVILPRTMSKQRVTRAKKLEKYRDRLSAKFDTNKVSIMYVDEVKGIEFDRVYVVDQDMERNERYIAYTRALDSLSIVH